MGDRGQIFPLELLESGSEAKPYLKEELFSSGYQSHSPYPHSEPLSGPLLR